MIGLYIRNRDRLIYGSSDHNKYIDSMITDMRNLHKMVQPNVKVMKGVIIDRVSISINNNQIELKSRDGDIYVIGHMKELFESTQEKSKICNENYFIKDIYGDFTNIIGEPISNVRKSIKFEEGYDFEAEQTFYKIETRKGSVTINVCGWAEYTRKVEHVFEYRNLSFDLFKVNKELVKDNKNNIVVLKNNQI